jgi:membrane-associated phospholipid phosphatase
MIPLRPPLRPRDWLVVVGAATLVLQLASLVEGKEPPAFDNQLLSWLGANLPGSLREALVLIYRLSGVGFTASLVALALFHLVRKRWWHDLGLLVCSTAGILAIVDIWLKPLFDRSRPHEKLIPVDGRSFPSGHAAGSIAFYLAMVAILAYHHPRLRLPLSLGALCWISLVWLSTLAARAHWPSDLLAGGAVGFAWLTICLAYWRASRTAPPPA